LTIENNGLKEENKASLTKIEDLVAENLVINRKNQLLTNEMENLKSKLDVLMKNVSCIEHFVPAYNLLRENFPNQEANGILSSYNTLENYLIGHTKRIEDLEEERNVLKEDVNKAKKDIQTKKYELRDAEVEKNKLILNFRGEMNYKDALLEDTNRIQEDYKTLFNKVIDLYGRFQDKMKVYITGEVRSDLKDPVEILDVIGRMINISSQLDLQEYLKKIMVSANVLQRKHFPEHCNDKFDVDKIYERINKYIESLLHENARLKSSNDVMKKQILPTPLGTTRGIKA
jgi:hypothetical protein